MMPVEPSIASTPDPVAPTLPVVVIVRGLSVSSRLIGPTVALLIVLAIFHAPPTDSVGATGAAVAIAPACVLVAAPLAPPVSYPLHLDRPGSTGAASSSRLIPSQDGTRPVVSDSTVARMMRRSVKIPISRL